MLVKEYLVVESLSELVDDTVEMLLSFVLDEGSVSLKVLPASVVLESISPIVMSFRSVVLDVTVFVLYKLSVGR